MCQHFLVVGLFGIGLYADFAVKYSLTMLAATVIRLGTSLTRFVDIIACNALLSCLFFDLSIAFLPVPVDMVSSVRFLVYTCGGMLVVKEQYR